jgi:hypothetical protein
MVSSGPGRTVSWRIARCHFFLRIKFLIGFWHQGVVRKNSAEKKSCDSVACLLLSSPSPTVAMSLTKHAWCMHVACSGAPYDGANLALMIVG